jgi:hypothetical protein
VFIFDLFCQPETLVSDGPDAKYAERHRWEKNGQDEDIDQPFLLFKGYFKMLEHFGPEEDGKTPCLQYHFA